MHNSFFFRSSFWLKLSGFFCLVFIFTSCEKESPINTEKINSQKTGYTIRSVSEKELKANAKLYTIIQHQFDHSTQGRPADNTRLNLQFNTRQGRFIEYEDYHSYTFPVTNTPEGEGLQNVLFSLDEGGSYRIFLVEYDIPETDIEKMRVGEHVEFNGENSVLTELDENLQPKIMIVCTEVTVTVTYCSGPGQHPGGYLPNGQDCPEHEEYWYTYLTDCSISGGGDSGTGPPPPPPSPSTGHGSFGGVTTPVPPCGSCPVLSIEMENFTTEYLTSEQAEWLYDSSNFAWYRNIKAFLDANADTNGDYTQESMDFALQAIVALMNGGWVDFGEAYISTDTPDDNYSYNGPKDFIPSSLTLDNGDTVNVKFGTTNSDGENANQEVALHLINGLKFALNQANNNLSFSEKITEIYIMATTNGQHSPTSNHTNGTAMDISRINGIKMALSGVTNQIIELQEAFDDYQYIRENFGPHFKHKYSIETGTWNYNHPVGGHHDHIHISTRI